MSTLPDTYRLEIRSRGHSYRTFTHTLPLASAKWDMAAFLSPCALYAVRIVNERNGEVVARAVPKHWL